MISASNYPVRIAAMGMVSSIGHDVVTSCAAARAGLTMRSKLNVLDFKTQSLFGNETLDGAPDLSGHVVRGVCEGFSEVGKALLLGAAALRDLLARTRISPHELKRTGMFVNLSDWAIRDTAWFEDKQSCFSPSAHWKERTKEFAATLAKTVGLDMCSELQYVYHGGNSGIAYSLVDAITLMQQGRMDRCLIGGIDSHVEPGFLLAAAKLGLLRNNECQTGLTPGEGAAFFLIERIGDSDTPALARIFFCCGDTPVAERATGPTRNDILSEILCRALAMARPRYAGDIWFIGDLDGSEQRAVIWGNCLLQLDVEHRTGIVPLWLPAATFGSTGAASGAIAVCAAARAFERGYAPRGACAIWSCSENGGRGTVLVDKLQH